MKKRRKNVCVEINFLIWRAVNAWINAYGVSDVHSRMPGCCSYHGGFFSWSPVSACSVATMSVGPGKVKRSKVTDRVVSRDAWWQQVLADLSVHLTVRLAHAAAFLHFAIAEQRNVYVGPHTDLNLPAVITLVSLPLAISRPQEDYLWSNPVIYNVYVHVDVLGSV